jgi:hypothetical protein
MYYIEKQGIPVWSYDHTIFEHEFVSRKKPSQSEHYCDCEMQYSYKSIVKLF